MTVCVSRYNVWPAPRTRDRDWRCRQRRNLKAIRDSMPSRSVSVCNNTADTCAAIPTTNTNAISESVANYPIATC